MADYAFKLFAQKLTETVTITTTTQELALGAQTVELDVAASTAGVATLPEAPVGLVVVLNAGTVGAGGTIVLTDPKGTTYTFNDASDTITLMAVDPNVHASGNNYIALANTSVTVS